MTDFTSLLALADQCVKCGLCLPQCPTYSLNLNENESPRGRISLVQALANEQLEVNDALYSHFAHCLQCRRCERVCPSQVKYGEIVNIAVQQIPALKKQSSFTGKAGLYFLQSSRRLRLAAKLLWWYQHSGLQLLARASGLLKLLQLNNIEQRLPAITYQHAKPVSTKHFTEKVALFTGCSQTVFDSKVISSTIKLLNMLGIEVVIPGEQSCCGALHKLQGEDATRLVNKNVSALKKTGIDTVLYLSTGCGAFIKEQYNLSLNFQEITEYLSGRELDKLEFKPLNEVAGIHMPCSQKNVLRQADNSTGLLQHIPGIKLVSFEQHGCCGAGGTTMLTYPQMADAIRQPLLDKVMQADCDTLVTTNPGCQLHLQHGFKVQNTNVKVIHPVTLLARQLEKSP